MVEHRGGTVDERAVARMTRALRHRGPDAEATVAGPNFSFGHCRLAVIDPRPDADQPMHDGRRAAWITYNGELYNYRELRDDLRAAGVVFHTRSDTEVVLHGCMAWGIEVFLRRARGMWAFALWDSEREQLLLARDRFGKKPLLYALDGTRTVFASSLPSLGQAIPTGALDHQVVAEFLSLGYVPPDRCIARGIHKVPAATWMAIGPDGASSHPYWQPQDGTEHGMSLDEALEETDRLLHMAVADRLVADVPIGSFLSGGIDSGLVTALMAERATQPRTYTMLVPDSWHDESRRARLTATTLATRHREVTVRPEDMTILPHLLALGEPLADSSIIPTALVARAAAQDLKVVLTGDGGDELFGGYGEPAYLHKLLRLRDRSPAAVTVASGVALRAVGTAPAMWAARRPGTMTNLAALHDGLPGYLAALDQPNQKVLCMLLGPALRDVNVTPIARFLEPLTDGPDWRRLLWAQLRLRLQGDFLVKLDVATMAFGLEARTPFLDHRLAEFALGLPWEVWHAGGETKGLLRHMAKSRLPRSVLAAPKHGFSIPCEEHLFGAWCGAFQRLVRDGLAAELGLVDPHQVLALHRRASRRPETRRSTASLFFALLCLEIWLRVASGPEDTEHELAARLGTDLVGTDPQAR